MAWTEEVGGGHRGRYRDANGRKQSVLDPDGLPFRRKSDARHAATEAEVKARRRATATRSSAGITWGQWWDRIAETRDNPATDTARTEAHIVAKHIRPWWGEWPLNRITQHDVQDWVNDPDGLKPRKGLAASTGRRIYNVFAATINYAVRKRVLNATPCVGVTLPPVPRKRKPMLTVQRIAELELRSDYRDVAEFILETGLRPGELCGLHANRLDLRRKWMTVADVYVQGRHVVRPYPKDRDAREVPLTPKAVAIIERRIEGRELTGGCGVPHTVDGCRSVLVFLTGDGLPMRPRSIGAYLRNRGLTGLYEGRRGWVTRSADGGATPFDIAAFAGHTDVRQTQEYWVQTPAARDSLIAALGQHEGLSAVEGQLGADPGADFSQTPSETVGDDSGESAV